MVLIKRNVPLLNYSNFKIGGDASYFLEVFSVEDIRQGIREWQIISKNFEGKNKTIFILGGGTNLLISDKGFEGLVIKISLKGIEKTKEGILVNSGESVENVLDFCIENSLSGLEWAGGLPGSIGGAVRGNAGAFKGEIKDSIVFVDSINVDTLEIKKRNNKELKFDYRSSIFKTEAKNEIILSVFLKTIVADKNEIKKLTQEKIDYRNIRHPMDLPSIGSTFKNIPVVNLSENQKKDLIAYVKDDPFPVIPVAKLLFLSDLKGLREKDAEISDKHPNFIVNLGHARYADVEKLIKYEKKVVKEKFDLDLEEEIMYL